MSKGKAKLLREEFEQGKLDQQRILELLACEKPAKPDRGLVSVRLPRSCGKYFSEGASQKEISEIVEKALDFTSSQEGTHHPHKKLGHDGFIRHQPFLLPISHFTTKGWIKMTAAGTPSTARPMDGPLLSRLYQMGIVKEMEKST